MAAGPWVFYDHTKLGIANGLINLNSHTFKMALFTSASNAGSTSNTLLADLTNECSGNGYVRQTVAPTLSEPSAGTLQWQLATGTFTASGGSITARRAVVFDDTAAGKPLVASFLLDATPADVVVADGQTLTVNEPGTGVFRW